MALLPGGKRVPWWCSSCRVVHCYRVPEAIEDEDNLKKLATLCRRMGKETNQGEVGLVIADEYFAIRNYEEPES